MLDTTPKALQGEITFRGRGLAYVHGERIVLKVCPVCSQWNAPKAAEHGHCGWCGYVPAMADAERTGTYLPFGHRRE